MVAEVGKKVLVYDTGPSYSPQFNAGPAIVAPYVRSRGIQVIDKLLISHGDMDHAGGFLGLNDSIDVEQSLLATGYFDKVVELSSRPSNIRRCNSSHHWAWPYRKVGKIVRSGCCSIFLCPAKRTPAKLCQITTMSPVCY